MAELKKYLNERGLREVWDIINGQNSLIVSKIKDIQKRTTVGLYADSTSGWEENESKISEAGALYIYTDAETFNGKVIAKVKIGDGTSSLADLSFIDAPYSAHIADRDIHFTAEERAQWNNEISAFVTAAGVSADTATQAASRAETAKASAETSTTQAETAKQGAENARAEAVTAQNAAKISADLAASAAQQTEADKTITSGYAKTAKTNADSTAADRQAVQEMATQVTTDKATVADHAAQVAEDRTAAETAAQTAQAVADSLPDDYVTAVGKIAENTAEINNTNTEVSELKEDIADKLEKANDRVYIGDIVDNKWQQDNGNEYGVSRGFYLSANVQPNTKYYATGSHINNSFPLIVMFDENNNAIGAKGLGEGVAEYDYEFVTPSNCVKVSVNGEKVPIHSYSVYPSLYYVQNKDLDGNDLESQINGKQNEIPEWIKATYQYEVNKYVMEQKGKAVVISNSTSGGYKYAKLIYDKNKKYRFFGQCKTNIIPILICCDENDNIIKIYDNIVDTIAKGKEYNDIPENTYCIYVNGNQLNARVEIKEQRNTASFESKKIGVCFGDSITQGNNVYISSNITPINDYPSVVGKTLDCTVYNGGLGGSTYSSGRSIDFKNVCDCVVSGDFSTVIDGISQYGLNASAVLQYNAISELDFNDVDFISIALGTNDWNFGASAEGIKNAMRYCISTLLTAYPHLRIYVFTPIYRFNLGGSGQDSDTYVNTASGLKLHDVCDAIIETAKEFNVPCKDMYYGCNINHYNKELYMGDDTHPNANGYALMGEKIAKFINSN